MNQRYPFNNQGGADQGQQQGYMQQNPAPTQQQGNHLNPATNAGAFQTGPVLMLQPGSAQPLFQPPVPGVLAQLRSQFPGTITHVGAFAVPNVPAPSLRQATLQLQDRLFGVSDPNSFHYLYLVVNGYNIRIFNEGPNGLRFRWCSLMSSQPHLCNDAHGCLMGNRNWFSVNMPDTVDLLWQVVQFLQQGAQQGMGLIPDQLVTERHLEANTGLVDSSRMTPRCINCALRMLEYGEPMHFPCVQVPNVVPPVCQDCIGTPRALTCFLIHLPTVQAGIPAVPNPIGLQGLPVIHRSAALGPIAAPRSDNEDNPDNASG